MAHHALVQLVEPGKEGGRSREGGHDFWAAYVPGQSTFVYPEGFATAIGIEGPAQGLEGAIRPHHFGGVATVVAKLLTAVRPDRVVFGQKDAQQVAVIRRLMRDLHLDDIEMTVAPIVRESDGLAMSSRNRYLTPERRDTAESHAECQRQHGAVEMLADVEAQQRADDRRDEALD